MAEQPNPIWPKSIWIVGCGNMGSAMLQGWLDNGAPANNISVIKPNQTPLPGNLKSQSDYPQDSTPDLVMLAMKPYHLDEVARSLSPLVDKNTKIVSILAGAELEILRRCFPASGPITRLMPNMAVTVGKSPMIFIAETENEDLREEMNGLFSCLGAPEWLDNEDQMHIATALSGSGPAFLFRVIDAFASSAAELEMEPEQAARLALAMIDGAATLAASSEFSPGALANQVAGRGGTTRKGLDIMDEGDRVNKLFFDVLQAAMKRNIEMAQEARK